MDDDQMGPQKRSSGEYFEMLYRYRHFGFSSEEHAKEPEQILLENKLWCSHPGSFNDPFDCRPVYTWTDLSVDEQVERLRLMMAERGIAEDSQQGLELLERARNSVFNSPEMRAALQFGIQQAIAQSSVCCFNRTWHDVRMWAHYAKDHSGYCLGFKFEDGWPEDSIPLPVEYVDVRPVIDLSLDSKRNKEAADDFVRGALLSKSLDWESENEVRIFRNGTPAGHFEFPPAALRELYLGYKILPENRERLLDAIRKSGHSIEVYQLRPHRERYELEAVKV